MLSVSIGRMSAVEWWGILMANGVESKGGWVGIKEEEKKR